MTDRGTLRDDIARWWTVFAWKGMKTGDRLKLWGTELCAILFIASIDSWICGLLLLATIAMTLWTGRTVDREALDRVLETLEFDDDGDL